MGDLGLFIEKNKKKIKFSFLTGRLPPFRPTSASGPASSPRAILLAHVRAAPRPAAELGGHVSGRRHHRSPRGRRGPVPLLPRLHPQRRVRLPLLHLICLPPSQQQSTRRRASATAHTCASPELAVLATTAHRQPPHLAPSTAFISCSPRSPQLVVVRLPSVGIARQSMAELTGEPRSVDSTPPLPLFSSPCAYLVRLCSPVLVRHSPCRLLARDGRPPLSYAAIPPWAMASSLPCLLGCVCGSARSASRSRV
jgi:hypothetical protein